MGRKWVRCLYAKRAPRVTHELFAPDACCGAGQPQATLFPQPENRNGIGTTVPAERGDDADIWLFEKLVDHVWFHAPHERVSSLIFGDRDRNPKVLAIMVGCTSSVPPAMCKLLTISGSLRTPARLLHMMFTTVLF